jgi:hypothetical protein
MSLARNVAVRVAPPVRRLLEQRDALRAENKALRKQLARRGDESRLSYVFIVTYGRSGSTLLQGLLNAQPGYLIRGENGGTMEMLYATWREMRRRKSDLSKPERASVPTHPWYGLDKYSPQQAADSFRRHMLDVVLRPSSDTRVTGFKEIRWWRHKDLGEFLEFVRLVFPGARFVFNTRDNADVIKSKWWADREESTALAQLADYEGRMAAAREQLGPAAYAVHYDDYVRDHDELRGLYEWLGEPFDRALVDEVLATRHSI